MSRHGEERAEVAAAATLERRRLADLLDGLAAADWEAPSLCEGWSVRLVVGHLVAALDPSPRAFVAAVLRARGDPHRANTDLARRTAGQPTAVLVDLLRRRADRSSAPPVVGVRGPLTDVVVHTGDVCRPLGLPHEPAAGAVRTALDFVTSGRPVGFVPRGLLDGLALEATDLGGRWGEGTPVRGRGVDLLMAACGRSAAMTDLGGDGAAVLARRLG